MHGPTESSPPAQSPFGMLPVSVMERADMTTTEKFMLLVLSSYADRCGVCWPSYAALSERAGISKRHAMRSVARLAELGELVIDHRFDDEQGFSSNLFTVSWIVRATSTPSDVDVTSPSDDMVTTPSDDIVTLNIPIRTDHKKTPPTPPRGDVQQVFDAWRQATGRNGSTKLDQKRKSVIERAIRDYGLDDTIAAVEGVAYSDYHMGKGPNSNGTKYNELTLILRDADRIEKFRDLRKSGGELSRVATLIEMARRNGMGMVEAMLESEPEILEEVRRGL